MNAPRSCAVAAAIGVLCLAGVATSGQPEAAATRVTTTAVVRPVASLLTQPVSMRFDHLPPGRVTAALRSTDGNGTTWASSAEFLVGRSGRLDLATARSIAGSYTGTHGMGLVWSLAPTPSTPGALYWWPPTPAQFDLSVSADGQQLAATRFTRRVSAAGVTTENETLAGQGFVGQLWMPPPGHIRHPAVLEFGGSEGGLDGQLLGAALSSAGYPTLDIAYFGEPGLPQTLSDIPLEYFATALTWLRSQSGVDPDQIYVSGVSRGSEAAQLLGVYYPSLVHGVIAAVPSDAAICSYPGCTGPAWTLHGTPLPYTKQFDNPYPTDDRAAVIPDERIRGPVLLVCGGADQVWVSCPYARAINARLTAHHDRYAHELYAYSDAGHGVGSLIPYEPSQVGPQTSALSGRFPSSNQLASAQVWPHVVAFLRAASAGGR